VGQLRHVLVHVATPVRFEDGSDGEWIEGEPGEGGSEPVAGDEFPCVLFLPGGSEDSGQPRSRKITRPTLLFEPVNADSGAAVAVSADDELLVRAPEMAFLTGAEEVRWQVEGQPQPFGPPGTVIGVQATLKRVES
jgi:hypothetical protein